MECGNTQYTSSDLVYFVHFINIQLEHTMFAYVFSIKFQERTFSCGQKRTERIPTFRWYSMIDNKGKTENKLFDKRTKAQNSLLLLGGIF